MARNGSNAQTVAATEIVEAVEKRTHTNWDVFVKAKVNPTTIVCNTYPQYHAFVDGCHTNLRLDANTMKAHLDGEHGGGFEVQLAMADEKVWGGWKELGELGVELVDLHCGVCAAQLALNVQNIHKHMKAHQNQNRRMTSGGAFLLTLGYEPTFGDTEE